MVKYEIIPIDYEFQRRLLANIKKHEAALAYCGTPALKDRIDGLKRQLRSMRTYIRYWAHYQGLKKSILVRGDEVQLKFILAVKHLIMQDMQRLRADRRRVKTYGKQFLGRIYDMSGGTHLEKGQILELAKHLGRYQLRNTKKPDTKDNYVGLEIECFGSLNRERLEELIVDKKMHKWCRTIEDRSIRPTDAKPNPIEINFMFKESETEAKLTEIASLLEGFQAEANDSCGLHVHLDARNRPVDVMFHNLVCFQDLFFRLNPSRIGNQYCVPVVTKNVNESNISDHYAAISSFAYQKYRTLEVRIHHGTTDIRRIAMWLKLLIRIANHPEKIAIPQDRSQHGIEDIPNVSPEEIAFFRSAV